MAEQANQGPLRIFPAIDLVAGQAVRLLQGDYNKMTVYDPDPLAVLARFSQAGATHVHVVDLEGARDGGTPNLATVQRIAQATGMFVEVGGGVRSLAVAEAYLNAGVDRVILGTAALRDPAFLQQALANFGQAVAVAVDLKQGRVATGGWTQVSAADGPSFCQYLAALGVATVIVTDISRDGAMAGTNLQLYAQLRQQLSINLVASGGVSSLEDVQALRDLGVNGAIIGKAYYTGAIDLAQAIRIGESV